MGVHWRRKLSFRTCLIVILAKKVKTGPSAAFCLDLGVRGPRVCFFVLKIHMPSARSNCTSPRRTRWRHAMELCNSSWWIAILQASGRCRYEPGRVCIIVWESELCHPLCIDHHPPAVWVWWVGFFVVPLIVSTRWEIIHWAFHCAGVVGTIIV